MIQYLNDQCSIAKHLDLEENPNSYGAALFPQDHGPPGQRLLFVDQSATFMNETMQYNHACLPSRRIPVCSNYSINVQQCRLHRKFTQLIGMTSVAMIIT